jgi:multidrug efflux pump subunit AcrB
MWEPMAVSIIFGLAFATVLTLGFVPVLYSLFYRVSFRDYRYG